MPDFVDIPINATAEELEAVARMGTAPEDGKAYGRKNGEWVELINTVEQDYNPDSANAQSGKAVAEAVSTKADANNVYTKTQTVDLVTAKTGNVNPTVLTVADFIGQHYINTANGKVFECIDINHETSEYFWLPISNPTVDRVYNSTSTNAQSGIAVSEAVSPKADKTYVDEQLGGKADKENTYTKSETQEYVSSATANFITATANNLINYYLKSEIYTKNEVQNLIGQIQTAHFEVVQELPQTGESNVIYLILRSDPETSNIYDEYIYINNAYEKIGSTDVDLTGYATESWVNQQIANFLTQTQIQSLINTALTNYYAKPEITALLNTKADKFNILDYITYDIENNNTTITITGVAAGKSLVGDITIPAFIEGLPVTKLKGMDSGADKGCFANQTALTSITLPDTLIIIDDRAFQGCSNLAFANIPNNVEKIGLRAFQGTKITNIEIPKSVSILGNDTFTISTAQGYIPYLANVAIYANISTLPTGTFYGNIALKTVYLPETITGIGGSAFFNCNSLADVYFGGTQAQWNAITIGSNNTALSTATIHYNQRPAIMQDVLDNSSPIKSISQNGTPITPDSSGNVDITGGTVDQTYDPTSTNAQSGTAVAEAVEDKLTEPSSGLAVGKYFRVASIDNDGHAVLECVDAPTLEPKTGATAPTTSTVADYVGQLYTTNYEPNTFYICVKIANNEYTWRRLFISNDSRGAVNLGGNASTGESNSVTIGSGCGGSYSTYTISIGQYTKAISQNAIAIGSFANAMAKSSVQFGNGTNNAEGTLQFKSYRLLETDGTIPPERITSQNWTDAQRLAVLLSLGCTVDENGYVKWTATPSE